MSEVLLNTPIQGFKMSCSPNELHYHSNDKCGQLLDAAVKAMDPTMLPNGPVRDLLERVNAHNKRIEDETKVAEKMVASPDAPATGDSEGAAVRD